jgi:LEA14-like dessication related protein
MLIMNPRILSGICIILTLVLFSSGCTEPPIKEPTVTVGDIALSDVSLQAMTVNTTVNIYNPNPVGAKLNKLAFDVYYLTDTRNYLGHGEKSNIEVKENGNTTVTIPVTIGNVQAVNAVGSLIQKGSIMLNINGSAFIDVKVTSYEKRFEQSRVFQASEFESLIPMSTIPATDISVSEGIQQIGGLLGSVT